MEYWDRDVEENTLWMALEGGRHSVLTQYKAFSDPVRTWVCLVRIPEHLSFEEASTLPCATLTAYNALMGRKPVKAGDKAALILGTGGVSIEKTWCCHTINYKTTADYDNDALRLTDGRDVMLELAIHELGGPGSLQKSVVAARFVGQVHIMIGFVSQDAAELTNIVRLCISKGIILRRGVLIGTTAQFESMNRLLRRRVVDKVFSFEEAINEYAYLENQQHVGRVVIHVGAESTKLRYSPLTWFIRLSYPSIIIMSPYF
ncbi:NAD(P)-binding protein [Armillaria luteobubalina]|uniref:NAD(P)-binding protein n=1 Tax=Armillaria luteobubalina TaxID=153913 RepID=A0AA39PXC8_9AGAR|nr:NAD(P)-binding protein [Armillaria luteobubalina]